jgi:hypothetical protein
VVQSVDLDGVIDGSLEIVTRLHSLPLRLTCIGFAPEFDMNDDAINEFYLVGQESVRELWVQFVLNWFPAAEGACSIRQLNKRSAHTFVSGQVTSLDGTAGFILNCGIEISVEFDKELPAVGQWVSLEGTLVCWPEGFSDL